MHKLFTSSLFFLLSLVLSMSTLAADTTLNKTITWHEWSNESFALAEEQNKLILLDISAQWCQFCKKMKAVTYSDPKVIEIINDNYIAIESDIEITTDVKMLYGNFGVPGTVILTAEREELNKRLGYISPQQMQWHLLGNLQDAPDTKSSINNNLSQVQ